MRLQIRFAPFEFLYLPVVDGYVFRLGGNVVPEVFDELDLFGRAKVEY